MKQIVAVLADYASISVGNKLNILGIFSNIVSKTVPLVYPQMQLVVRYEFDSTEAGSKDIKVVLVDDDGRELFSISGQANVARSPHGEPCFLNQIIQLNNITFPQFGDYEFRVLIDNRTESVIPFRIVQLFTPQA